MPCGEVHGHIITYWHELEATSEATFRCMFGKGRARPRWLRTYLGGDEEKPGTEAGFNTCPTRRDAMHPRP